MTSRDANFLSEHARSSLLSMLAHERAELDLVSSCVLDDNELLRQWSLCVQEQVVEACTGVCVRPFKDCVVECVMCRYDVLRPFKRVVYETYTYALRHGTLAGLIGRSVQRSFSCVVAAIAPSDVCGPVLAWGMSGVYVWTVPCWLADDTPDSQKTMAAIDRAWAVCEPWLMPLIGR